MILPELPTDLLWRNALAMVPLAVLVAALCRWLPCRPSTRHTMWLTLLLLLIALPLLPSRPDQATNGAERSASVVPAATLRPAESRPPGRPEWEPRGPSGPFAGSGAVALADSTAEPPADALAAAEATVASIAPPSSRQVRAGDAEEAHPSVDGRSSALEGSASASSMNLAEPAPGAAPLEPTAVPSSSQAPGVFLDTSMTDVRRWLTQLGEVRDAVMGLPPVPTSIWTAGVVLLLVGLLVRRRRSRTLLRRATPAPAAVGRLVTEASMQMDLVRVPEVLMTDDRLSPMVWCGRTPRLVLPWPLWRQLDELGRRAVVLHELAHLRRRDHWVCWAELLVGVVYWWHPVVWWVRRRLREEADLSCDAWVTTLLPAARRAYAQALLDTRKYVSASHATPAIGLGSGTFRAKRFARRLTMVMTEHNAPRLSLRGVIMTATLAAAACLAVPVLACPPKDKAPEPPAKPLKLRFTTPTATAPEPLGRPETRSPEETTFEQFVRTREGQEPQDRDERAVERRIRQLERQLEQMQQRLERYLEEGQRPRGRGAAPGPATRPSGRAQGSPRADAPPRALSVPRALSAPRAPAAPRANVAPRAPAVPGAIGPAYAPAVATLGPASDSDCATVRARKYELAKGRLDDLAALMVRQDVPVLVAPMDDAIELHGNLAQHTAFAAFVKMIGDDDERVVRYDLSEGKLELLQKLMARSDVPIIVELESDHIKVHGNDLEQMVFAGFVQLIEPGEGTASRAAAGLGRAERYFDQAAEAYEDAARQSRDRGRGANRRGRLDAQRMQMEAQISGLDARNAALEAEMEALESQAQILESQAEEMEEQADELEEHAEELEEEAEELEGQARRQVLNESRAILETARQLMQQARQVERQAQQMERQMQQLERQAERAEEEADKIRDRLEELEEEAENARDSEGAR